MAKRASPLIHEQVGFILVIAFFPAFIHGNGLGRQGKSPLKNWLDFSGWGSASLLGNFLQLARSKLLNPIDMHCLPSVRRFRGPLRSCLEMLLLGGLAVQPVFGNTGAQAECITPDGRVSPVSSVGASSTERSALIMNDGTIICPLQEGETTFIITLPKPRLLDRFTFVNQNSMACGELNIAISNDRLASNSPKWSAVDGIVPFAHKRLFNLSMLGVEAKYVKLSFRVEKVRRFSEVRAQASEPLPPAAGPSEDRRPDYLSVKPRSRFANANLDEIGLGKRILDR
jgi:hypothetical protein